MYSGIYEMNLGTNNILMIHKYIYDRPDFSLKLNRDLFYILNLSSPLYFLLISFQHLLKSFILSVTQAEIPKTDW